MLCKMKLNARLVWLLSICVRPVVTRGRSRPKPLLSRSSSRPARLLKKFNSPRPCSTCWDYHPQRVCSRSLVCKRCGEPGHGLVAHIHLHERLDVGFIVVKSWYSKQLADIAISVHNRGRIHRRHPEDRTGRVWVTQAVGGFEADLGLANAAEAFDDSPLTGVVVCVGGNCIWQLTRRTSVTS